MRIGVIGVKLKDFEQFATRITQLPQKSQRAASQVVRSDRVRAKGCRSVGALQRPFAMIALGPQEGLLFEQRDAVGRSGMSCQGAVDHLNGSAVKADRM